MVFAAQSLRLLLESLKVTVLGGKRLLQAGDLARFAGFRKTGGVLIASLLAALDVLDLVLESENLQDHHVGAVEDEGEEQRETAEIHVALGVEFPGLDLEAIRTECGSSTASK